MTIKQMKQIKEQITTLAIKPVFLLTLIFIFSFSLRLIFVANNSISFHYDMARDAFVAQEIWRDHDLKILGPPSSTAGFYHGVLYYYLIAPLYLIGAGNPQIPALFLSFLSCLTIIPLYLLSIKIVKEKKWALLSCLFFAVSFEATQYGPWLSNPGSALLFCCLFFLGLEMWREEKPYGLPLAALSASIATQFQFFFLYLFLLIPIYKLLFNTKVYRRNLLASLGLLTIGLSSFIVSILKFKTFFLLFNAMTSIIDSKQSLSSTLFTNLAGNYINRLASLFTNNFFPVNLLIGGIIGILVIYSCRKDRLIMFMLFSSFPIFIVGGHNSNYANLGILIPAIIALTKTIKDRLEGNVKLRRLIIATIILVNFYSIVKIIPVGQVSFVIPKDMVLSQQLKIIDKTYQIASGKPFSINTLTLPTWTNTTWAYLYSWYGSREYGYNPYYYGRDQVGMPGDGALVQSSSPMPLSFYIIEPTSGIPPYVYASEIEAEDSKTSLVSEYQYGGIILQSRIPK